MADEGLKGAAGLGDQDVVTSPFKLFLASSGTKKQLAKALGTKIEEAPSTPKVIVEVVPWFRDDAFPPGKTTLQSLIEHCRGSKEAREAVRPSDFCAVLLTEDDHRAMKGEEGDVPRDNCIFELGLFLGGLGFDPERCFMVCSVDEKSLPSDLKGYTYLKIEEPKDLDNKEECATKLGTAAQKIKNRVKKLRRYAHPEFAPVFSEEILRREAPSSSGGELLADSEVILSLAAPFLRLPAASQLLDTMRASIRYLCFVRELEADKLARFILKLATANCPAQSPAEDLDVVRRNIETMRLQLSIHANPGQTSLEFVIHNASEDDRAICYIRFPYQSKFLELARFQDTKDIVRGLKDSAIPDEDIEPLFIFRPTKYFDAAAPVNSEQLRRLRQAIKMKFDALIKLDPSLQKKIEVACFGPSEPAAAAP